VRGLEAPGSGSGAGRGFAGRQADIVNVLPDDKVADNLADRTAAACERKVGWVRGGRRFDQVAEPGGVGGGGRRSP